MTTKSQKASYVIDHLVEALGNHSSSSIRRAIILTDIAQYPGTTQTGVMERLSIHKSALNREIEWLFDYGCIIREASDEDAREVKLEICGYSKNAFEAALEYFDGEYEAMKAFLKQVAKTLKQEKPTLRDAKIISVLYDSDGLSKQDVMDRLYGGSASTENRAINKLAEQGIIKDV